MSVRMLRSSLPAAVAGLVAALSLGHAQTAPSSATSQPATSQRATSQAAATQPAAWVLTTLQGQQRQVPADVAMTDEVLRLVRAAPQRNSGRRGESARTASDLVLVLRDGRRLPGSPGAATEGEKLVWNHRVLGEIIVPLTQLAGVERFDASKPEPAAPPAQGQDVAVLANGDRLVGLVSAVSPEGLSLQPPNGDPITVPWTALVRLAMTDIGAAPNAAAGGEGGSAPGYRVELVDGSILTSSEIALGSQVTLKIGSETVTIPADDVSIIERVGFAAWPLSLLTPTETVHHPYLTASRPPVLDATLAGGPLLTRRGMTLTAQTRMTWRLPAGFSRLTLRYVLDPSARRGGATVRVLAGDRVLHEGPAGEQPSEPLDLALGDSQRGDTHAVTLEVSFGSTPGVLARVNILEPLLLK